MARKLRKYSPEFKIQAIEDYKAGKGSLRNICKKYGIKDHKTLREWISCYNGQKEFRKRSGARGEIFMTKGRKTTQEERSQIVAFCIEHGKDYGLTVETYKVSYQQIYSWVRKYNEKGAEGLVDKRGKRKIESEMTELEKLRAENKMLEARNKRLETENAVLKKLEEIERRWR